MKKYIKCEMENTIILTMTGIWSKITALLSTFWGWLSVLVSGLLTFLLPLKFMFVLLFVILLFDFIFGLWAAIKDKKQITSDKMRGTLIKSMVYLVVISLTYAAEALLGIMILHKVLFALAALVELYSITANLLIIKPDMPFLSLFKGLVSGEISNKLGITQDLIQKTLDSTGKKPRLSSNKKENKKK